MDVTFISPFSVNTDSFHQVQDLSCGQVKIRPPKLGFTNLVVNGVAIDVTTLTSVVAAPKCTAGVLKTPQTTPLKTDTGTIVVPGLTANASVPVTYDTAKVKNLSINSCGFGVN